MINKAILETQTFHDLKLLSECFIDLVERATEENDLGIWTMYGTILRPT